MKIFLDPHPKPVLPSEAAPEPPGRRPGLFVDLLERALEAPAGPSAPAPAAGPSLFLSPSAPEPPAAEVCDRAEEILNGLETYAARLADPAVGLRELDALLADLDPRCRGLASLAEGLPADSGTLREIAARVLLAVERERFHLHRGDYLAA